VSPLVLDLPDEASTRAFAGALAAIRPRHGVVHLAGDLGAGKTTWVRGFLQSAGHGGPVRSPTYTLVEPYAIGDTRLFHLDLYRLADPEELEFIGLRDLLDDGLLLVEWPDRGQGVLPPPSLRVQLAVVGSGRRAWVDAKSDAWPGLATTLETLKEKIALSS
jgi:tRNA threonylcarbamoyladenosine biosynthesis protein TsaE